MRNMFRFVSRAAGLAPVALAALTGAAAAADPTSLRIEVYGLMGLHVLTLHSTLGEAGDRYDLQFSDAGRKKLSSVAGQQFEGEATACKMQRQDLPGIAQPEKDEGARQGTIWYARLLPGDVMVPVRMQLEAQIGVVDGYLAELHGRGVNLKLME